MNCVYTNSDRAGQALVCFIQLILVCITFNRILFEGDSFVFSNGYDGAKNYFTLQGYVQQPAADCLKFKQMNYPYGDYIYYTDNTPLFSLPERVVLNTILRQPHHAVFFFNLLILSGIFLSSLILFKLLRQFSFGMFYAITLSVMLPWLSPQMMRLGGHFNLSLSFLLLLVIYLLAKRVKKSAPPPGNDVALAVVLLLSGYVHLYFLLISLVFVSSFFLFSALLDIKNSRPWLKGFMRGGIICLSALVLFYALLRITDEYYLLRRASAEGYNFDEWKLQLRAFVTPYLFHPFSKLLSAKPLPYESFGYSGTGALIGFAGSMLFFTAKFSSRKMLLAKAKAHPAFPALLLLLLAALPGVLIAMGEQIRLTGDLSITNYLNPFFYLRKYIPQITHFRCLGRFSWYFFWSANLFIFSLAVVFSSRRYFKALGVLMLCGVFADTFFSVKYSASAYEVHNPFSNTALKESAQLFETINTSEYQALLAFPFYHVGSENYDYTIDPEDVHCIKTMQLSLASGLPLINSKMSRTPLQHTYNIFSLFGTAVSYSLLRDLNNKPVLVYLDKSFYKNDTLLPGKTPVTERMPAKNVLLHGHGIIRTYRMSKLAETDGYAWYAWDINLLKQRAKNSAGISAD